MKRMQHVTEELNPARSAQVSAGVPLHDAIKITLETLLGVSNLLSLQFLSLFSSYLPLSTPYLNVHIILGCSTTFVHSWMADRAMEELAKANNNVLKLGGDAIACKATMAELDR